VEDSFGMGWPLFQPIFPLRHVYVNNMSNNLKNQTDYRNMKENQREALFHDQEILTPPTKKLDTPLFQQIFPFRHVFVYNMLDNFKNQA